MPHLSVGQAKGREGVDALGREVEMVVWEFLRGGESGGEKTVGLQMGDAQRLWQGHEVRFWGLNGRLIGSS